jgi:outer membrane protein OmpA-like peptidoglycan-associated protein
MRILTTGFIVFVIWAFFSTWLYVDVLRHDTKKPAAEVVINQQTNVAADSLAKLEAMMPKDLTILFDFDRSKFKPDPQLETKLQEFRSWLGKFPGSILLITGYTDLVGENAYNQDLGLKRAQEVQKYLGSAGFPSARLTAVSKGEQDPASGYITQEERAAGRKVVISVKRQN